MNSGLLARVAELEALLRRALDLTEHSGCDPDCPGCRMVADIEQALGVTKIRPRDIEEASEEEREDVRNALRGGGEVRFSEEAKASLRARGLTEDEVVAMLMNTLGMKPQ